MFSINWSLIDVGMVSKGIAPAPAVAWVHGGTDLIQRVLDLESGCLPKVGYPGVFPPPQRDPRSTRELWNPASKEIAEIFPLGSYGSVEAACRETEARLTLEKAFIRRIKRIREIIGSLSNQAKTCRLLP